MRSAVLRFIGATVGAFSFLAAGTPSAARAGCPAFPERGPLDPRDIRVIVVEHPERLADALRAARTLGANALSTHSAPDSATAAQARAAGVHYIAYLTTREVERVAADPEARDRLASISDVSGIYYEDDEIVEGYTSPEDQRRTYETLKEIFPGALVLHPTRLDPIAFDPRYLDAVYRPEYTDAVTPYFYPVGTTILGTAAEEDSWQPRLESLLSEIARRTPDDVPVLPVLQAFEQDGFPVDAAFLEKQFEVYARVWPGNRNAAAFEWGGSAADAPLVGFGFRPGVREGVRTLFRRLGSRECVRARRPAVP
ncbi:MAG: hypothetical protein M3R62_09220 [Acidobacteriota bacterium]|nr:hypothetical protein [Acidobacteriota bacterium]